MPKKAETVRIETVTPAMAEKWLAGNVRNRHLRPSRVASHVGILQRGEWELTGDAIVFDEEGTLINGQHRLSAIAEVGRSARLVVLRGVPTRAQDVMDAGLKRSVGDVLRLRGYTRWFGLAAALNWLYRLDYIEETGNVHYASPGDRPTAPQLLYLLEECSDLPEYLKGAESLIKRARKLGLRLGMTTAVWYRMAEVDAEEAEAFFESLRTGLELKATDPIYQLRRILLNDSSAIGRMGDYRQAALICKAWNSWREGKPVQNLAWKFGGTQREAFPIPR